MSKGKMMWITALILGLGWAIRGHFGHEWGASWAGAMAALAVLATSKREDWLQRAPVLTALGALGWAVAGMASYGIVIGYCRGVGFGNVLYGYTMLAIIGGLYGFMGGGLFGLGLETSDKKRPDWPKLITEMVIGGFLFYGLFIFQLGWNMTPPRSEMWAGAMGASLALGWYLYREGYGKALRVAGYSALGAGFGFAFGNFIQTFGATTGTSYNWWNVMEFTLGFCGGLGLAYAVATQDWPEKAMPSKTSNWYALFLVIFLIPLINFIEAMKIEYFTKMAPTWGVVDTGNFAATQLWFGIITIAIFTSTGIFMWKRAQLGASNLVDRLIPVSLFAYSFYYTFFGFIRNGLFYKGFELKYSDTLYFPILLIALIIWIWGQRQKSSDDAPVSSDESWKTWAILLTLIGIVLIIITLISINMHDGLAGYHERF
ncbi:MAG: hypothetical protein DWQ05_21435 [Calditrichaeota bacterium]|nr:MAG: hypothetical protein DWQ05_21435 [Calditrichota bacterium]